MLVSAKVALAPRAAHPSASVVAVSIREHPTATHGDAITASLSVGVELAAAVNVGATLSTSQLQFVRFPVARTMVPTRSPIVVQVKMPMMISKLVRDLPSRTTSGLVSEIAGWIGGTIVILSCGTTAIDATIEKRAAR